MTRESLSPRGCRRPARAGSERPGGLACLLLFVPCRALHRHLARRWECTARRMQGKANSGHPEKEKRKMIESTIFVTEPQTTPRTRDFMPADGPVNVGDTERWLSILGGGLLALYLLRRSLGTIVLLGGAGALLYRGLTGHCALYQTMAISTVSQVPQPDSPHGVTESDQKPLIVLAGS